ncbi:MAG: hypothetical protein ABSE89_04340 [Sedimentisphaerales bacterium]
MKRKAATKDIVFLQLDFWLRFLLAVAVSLPSGQIALAQQQKLRQQRTDYFKLISTIEYTAKRDNESKEYRHQAEPWFMVTTIPQKGGQASYHLMTTDFRFEDSNFPQKYKDAGEINYNLADKRIMNGADADLTHVQLMNNECIKTIGDRVPNEVGKTWTCRFNLGIFNHYSLPNELKFTVTSIKVPTAKLGDLVAVRAISDPFLVKAAAQTEGYGFVKCRMAAVYLFDPYSEETGQEDIYVSAMVFLASTKMDGMTQQYRYEFGTYKTDASAVSVDMNGLDKKLEGFVRDIQLTPRPIEVNNPCCPPQWVQSEIGSVAQIASTCAAVACEQTIVNPVSNIYMAAARTYQLQQQNVLVPIPFERTVCEGLKEGVIEISPMNICEGREIPLWPAAFIPLAFIHCGHGGGHEVEKSPSSP